MQLKTFASLLFTLVTAIQALPVERRSMYPFYGVVYTGKNADGSCQSASQVTDNVQMMKNYGINRIRTYSQECSILPNILNAIATVGGGMEVVAAVWIDGSSGDATEISKLESVLSSNKHDINPVSHILVGNEVLFKNVMSSSQLVGKIDKVKAFANGIPVGFAEADSTDISDLVAASDFVGVNLHPFYASVDIQEAVSSIEQRYNNVVGSSGGKQVIITETGWPSAGGDLGAAVSSVANEKSYAAAISRTSLPFYYFEWVDSSWKGASTEGHFGLMDKNNDPKF